MHAVDKVSCPVNVQQIRENRKKQQGYAFIVKREKLSRPDPRANLEVVEQDVMWKLF